MAISDLLSLLFLTFGTSVLFFGFVFLWHLWITGRPYRKFPSVRLDASWLFKTLIGQHPKNVSSTSVFLQEVIKNSQKFYEDGICVMWFLHPYVFVYSENAMKILATDPAVANKTAVVEAVKDVLGNGLLGSTGKLWSDHRKLLNPAFSLSVVKGNMNIFNQNAEILVNEFQSTVGKPTEDMLRILKRCTFDIVAASIFDLDVKDERLQSKTEVLIKLVDEMTEFMVYKVLRPWLKWRFLSSLNSALRKYNKKLKKFRICVDEILDDVIKSYIASETWEKYSDNDMEVRRTLPQILIKQHLEDPTFTKDNLREHFQNFMAAGYDTVAYSLMWCLYLLGHHPEVQEKACKEIESVVRVKNVTYDDLANLKYLNCIIKESLRLYSTAPFYGRKASKDIRYGKYTIPKDAEVVFSPFLLHRNPNIYPEPMKFKPERFADSSTVRPWMHIPFAEGYRSCIGKKFAMMEMKVLLVHILREFQIKSLDTVTDNDLDWVVILKTTKPLRMLFEIRHAISSRTCHERMNKESRTASEWCK